MNRHLALILLPLLLLPPAIAQSSRNSGSAEDIVQLEAFSVANEPEPAYKADAAVAGSRYSSRVTDPQSASYVPQAPVGIVKRAESVAVQFVLSNNGDKQDTRNQELYDSFRAVENALKTVKGATVEQREVHFTGGNRKFFSLSSGSATASFLSVLVLADLPPDSRVVDRVKQLREVLSATKLMGRTKYSDGSVGLYLKDPDQYRHEILQKIFDDVAFVKKGFSDEFEILPAGLNSRVRMRVAAESEIELWIDYSYSIRSIRELEANKNSTPH